MARDQQTTVNDIDDSDEVQILEDGDNEDLQILDAEPIAATISGPSQVGQERAAECAQRQRLPDHIFNRGSAQLRYPDRSRVRLELGMTVQSIKTGDILQIYVSSKSLANMLDKISHEVCMIQILGPGDEPHESSLILYDFDVDDLGKVEKVHLIITNQQRHSNPSVPVEKDFIPTYECRWKLTQIRRSPRSAKDRKIERQAFQRPRYSECSPGRGVADYLFREQRDHECSENKWYVSPALGDLLDCKHRYTFFDAFCGSGFASRGAIDAGLLVLGGFDHDDNAQLNYALNHPKAKLWRMKQDQFLRTRASRYRGRTRPGQHDMENYIAILGLSEFLRTIKPRIVVIEETSGLAECEKHRDSIQSLMNDFTRANYEVEQTVLNFAEYGLAQNRRRLIVIAAAPGQILPNFPQKTHNVFGKPFDRTLLKPKTVADVLACRIRGHPNHNPDDPALKIVPPVRGYDARQRQINTVTCSGGGQGNLTHPSGCRKFSVHEVCLLQGGSARHQLQGTRTECLARAGDACPSCIAELIYRECIKALRETDRQHHRHMQRLANNLDEDTVDALLRKDENLRSRRQLSRDLGQCREVVSLDESDQEEASKESVHSVSNGYKMPTIIDDDPDDDRDTQIATQLSFETVTPRRGAPKRGLADDEISEIRSDEFSKSTPRKRRQLGSFPLRAQSATPTPRRSSDLDLAKMQREAGVRQL
ncbi:hypothetical protein MBLNU457_g0312t2 [Dothideomycetes sp. NU457]